MSSPQQPAPDPQAAQAGLAILVGLAISKLWPSLDFLNLRQSLPAFKAAVAQQVQQHAQASATLAVRQYRLQRVAAGVGAGFTPTPADPPSVEQIAQAVDWAVQPLWSADVLAEPTTEAGSSAIADAKARLAASSERLVLDAGRNTIVDNVQADRRAKGWARVPEPGACYFCALLATRGAVYKSGSFNVANAKFKGEGMAKTHDHCRCHMEPVFTAYEPSAQIREWQQQYEAATKGVYGSKPAQLAWRRAFEGRTANGRALDEKPGRKSTAKPVQAGPNVDNYRAQLAALEKSLPNLNEQQAKWTRDRIAALRKLIGD